MYSIKYIDGFDVEPSLYIIDVNNKTFYSGYNNLVLDFEGYDGWFFEIWFNCILKVGNGCKLRYWLKGIRQDIELEKGLHLFSNKGLYKDVDKNWAILNSRHDDEFVRQVCKDILSGSINV